VRSQKLKRRERKKRLNSFDKKTLVKGVRVGYRDPSVPTGKRATVGGLTKVSWQGGFFKKVVSLGTSTKMQAGGENKLKGQQGFVVDRGLEGGREKQHAKVPYPS